LPFSQTQKRIRRELREQRALLSLAIERKTLKIKRDNLDRVVFYPEHNIAFNRIAKSGNSSVILYLDEAIRGPSSHQNDYKQAKRSAMGTGKSLVEMSWTKQDRASLKRLHFLLSFAIPGRGHNPHFSTKSPTALKTNTDPSQDLATTAKPASKPSSPSSKAADCMPTTTGNHRTMRYSCPHPSSKAFAGLNVSPLNFPMPWPNQA